MWPILITVLLLQATYIDLYKDGSTLLAQGKLLEAETRLVESLNLKPDYVPTLKALAKVYEKRRRYDEAIEKYRMILNISPRDISARAHLADLYSWIGDYENAIVTYRTAVNMDPHNPGLKTGLAKVMRWAQRYDEAEGLYRDVLQQDPDNYEALKGLGKTLAMEGDFPGAIDAIDRAIELYPYSAELYKEKGTILGWQRNYKEALMALEKAIELSPEYVNAYRTIGDIYYWMRDYGRSIESYKKAASLERDNIENYLLLARVYRTIGKDRLAEESVKRALRISPDDIRALNMLNEIRDKGQYGLLEGTVNVIHTSGFIFTLILIFYIYRSKKRMLKRRHMAYLYFTNLVLPFLVVITFGTYIGRDFLHGWIDGDIMEDLAETFLFFSLGTSFLALLWTEKRSKEFDKSVVLAIGAHPDDIELGCGGVLLKARDSGASIYGLTFTRGEKGNGKNGNRENELKRAAKFMEMDNSWILEFPDTELKNHIKEIKNAIEEKIRETGANVIFTHTPLDIHSDHQAVFEATKEAARGLSIISYEDVSTSREFVPNYYVDISEYIEDKVKLISFHKTQGDKTYMDPDVIRGRAAHRGLQCGVSYAEAFRVYRLLR